MIISAPTPNPAECTRGEDLRLESNENGPVGSSAVRPLAALAFLLAVMFGAAFPLKASPGFRDQIPAAEYDALVALYQAAQGDGWLSRSGWLDPNAIPDPQNPTSAAWAGVAVAYLTVTVDGQPVQQGHVVTLQLAGKNLVGALPDAVTNLAFLGRLDVSGNHLRGNLPDLGRLPLLTQIDISGNLLDVHPGTSNRAWIDQWIAAGKTVVFEPQRAPGTNADLATLSLGDVVLAPALARDREEYFATVPAAMETVRLVATPADPDAIVAMRVGGGDFVPVPSGVTAAPAFLNPGPTTIEVRVVAGDGSTMRTYTIRITKPVELPAVADARIGTTLALDGGSHYLSVFQNASQIQATLLKFNVASLPPSQVVTQAILTLNADAALYSGGNPGGLPIDVYRVTQPWNESQVSWTQRDTQLPWSTAGGDYVGTTELRGIASYGAASPALTNNYASPSPVSWDVTTLAREWVSGSRANNGLMLLSRVGNGLHFRSRELGASGPTLSLFLTPVPEITTLPPSAVQSGSATLQATLVMNGTKGTLRFLYGRNADAMNSTESRAIGTNGSYSAAITGLAPGTTYRVQAVVTTDAGTTRGPELTFTTGTGASSQLASLQVDAAPLSPAFAPEVLDYRLDVDRSVSSISVVPTASEPGQSIAVRVDGGAFVNTTSGAYSPPLAIGTGTHLVEVRVTPSDNGTASIYRIMAVQAPVLGWTTYAGLPGVSGSTNGGSSGARFNTPAALAVDGDGFVYVADQANFAIRRISPSGEVTTLAGLTGTSGTNDGPGTLARFLLPQGITLDGAGNLYVADTGNHTVRKLTRSSTGWTVSTVAGSPGVAGAQDGTAMFSRFNQPMGVAFDAAAGVLYVADMGNHAVRRVTPQGVVSTFAGELGVRGNSNGTGPGAHFNSPQHLTVDPAGNVLVADTGNCTVRRITPAAVTTTLAGSAGNGGNVDGPASIARFNSPAAVALDAAGNLLVTDNLSHTLRKITAAGVVSTVAGLAGAGGVRNGVGDLARFNHPFGVVSDRWGTIYVADSWNHIVRRAAPGVVYSEDFEGTIGPEWSLKTAGTTPTGSRKFLGEFGNQTVTLSLSNLPPHGAVTIALDLLVIRSWDGSLGPGAGPDQWSVLLGTGETVFTTTFANLVGSLQSYPASYPGTLYRWQTMAVETNSLGFISGSAVQDAVYHIETTIPNNATNLQVRFRGSGLQALSDESWGIDNVHITTLAAAGPVLSIDASYVAVREDATNATITIRRLGDASSAAAVDWSTEAGTALPVTDYTTSSGRLYFGPGETNATISVPIRNDAVVEGTEKFAIRLTNPTEQFAMTVNTATVQINDDDGFVEVSQPELVVRENDYGFYFTARWLGNTNEPVGVVVQSFSGTASDGTDYSPVVATIVFNPGETSKSVYVFVSDDTLVEGEETFNLRLVAASQSANLHGLNESSVLLLDNDRPGDPGRGANANVQTLAVQRDGKILAGGPYLFMNGVARTSLARLNSDGSLDTTFSPATGGSYWVETLALQSDGKILVGGSFTYMGGQTRNRIARLTTNGAIDTAFAPTGGANNTVVRIANVATNKILLVGAFTTANGVARNRIARLNLDGSLDTTFDPGAGANNTVYCVAEQSDGRLVISGAFSTVNSTARNRLARLNANGSLDTSFNVGSGMTARANVIITLPGDKLLLGGLFTTNNGVAINRVMRLNADGTIDPTFSVGVGPDNGVQSMEVQPDGKILVGGDFTHWNGLSIGNLVRLNPNGTLDTTFALSTGGNGSVLAVTTLPDGRVAAGGAFTVFNGSTRSRLAILPPDGVWPDEPVSWTRWSTNSGGNDHFYALTRRAQSWTNAEAEAVSWGGHLVTVNNASEQEFVTRTFLNGLDRIRPFWIGLYDAATEGSFAWSSGEPFGYANWDAGEPNNKNDEDFAVINWGYSYNASGQTASFAKWNDVAVDGFPGAQSTGPHYGIMEVATDPALPRIVTPPQARTVIEGSRATLSVTAAGPGPLAYQWRKDGVDMPGSTHPTLALEAARMEDAGAYSVRVSNPSGSVTSGDAILRVVPAPSLAPSQWQHKPDGSAMLRLDVPIGMRTVLEASSDLRTWTVIADQVAAAALWEVADPAAATAPVRFYRLKLLP